VDAVTWLVVIAGIAAILWVNWYFFVAGRSAGAAASGSAVGEQVIVVDGGYSPSTIKVRAGSPVRLVFDRRDSGACTDEIVLPDFGIRKFIPTGEKTSIEVTPPKPGRYDFTCGMSMHHGVLIAEA
jgi:plastocyanin domain-containing protein